MVESKYYNYLTGIAIALKLPPSQTSMAYSNSELEGKSFYQSEPLIARLRGIIRDYPEGVGILKELIQNADDAKATRVEITLDWRNHQVKKLPDDRMVLLMGPAMLVYNDRVFTDKDFDSIRSLGQSEKAGDLQKTGRFGVGFNAIYHVTDFPSFVSRDRIIFFDPHGAAIPGTSRQEPGREWNLAEAKWYEKYPDFMQVYAAGGLPFGDKNFQGTLFRLPLRTAESAKNSEIRKQAFTESNVKELLDELRQSGEELLLFLKSVREIRVYEIPANSQESRQEILAIVTKNPQQVREARQKLLDAIPDTPEKLLELCDRNSDGLVSVSYLHEIETISCDRTIKSTWRTVCLIRTDEGGDLAKVITAMHQSQEKVVPWAGAAARISAVSTEGNLPPVSGKVYCFLPLPLETGLPIHINGFFNLNSSRDNLSSDSGQTGKDKPRAIWNGLLARHVLSHACANLIVDLVQDIGQFQPEEFYQLWPVSKITASTALAELHIFVMQLLYQREVVRSAVTNNRYIPNIYSITGKMPVPQQLGEMSIVTDGEINETRWVTPPSVQNLPSKKWWDDLLEPLRADNIEIPNPTLPESILAAFKDAGLPLLTLTAANLRKHLIENKSLGVSLSDAPKASLRNRQWIANLLRYCLSDNCRDLRGLPLAILADNTLQVFGYNPIGTIYIADEAQRDIFASYPEWFLHRDLAKLLPGYNLNGISNMTAAEVAKKLVNVVGSTASEIDWNPDAAHPPNAEWLTLVYNYFYNISPRHLSQETIEALKKVPLVPGNNGKLYKGGFVDTPLLRGDKIEAEIIAAVQYFGATLVNAPPKLAGAIALFADRHKNQLVYCITGPDVLDIVYLQCDRGLPPYDEKHYTHLLNFLASREQKNYDESSLNKLRQLPIYPTTSGEIVSLNSDSIYLPGDGYEPPEIAGGLQLLRIGKAREWLPLFQLLQVPVLTRARLIRDCLLPEYASFSPEEQSIALTWIRDNLSQASIELEKGGENAFGFREELKKARLVRCSDRRLRSAESIYNPLSEVVRNIIGNVAAIPDMEFYSQDSQTWLTFFSDLGMRQNPDADDILACVDNLIQTANRSGVGAVSGSCIAVFNYIADNWDALKNTRIANSNKTLPEALADKAWLPVEANPEKLSEYFGAAKPEPRLYRAKDLCFIQDAALVASQKFIFARPQRDLLKVEIRTALGFELVEPNTVIEHFDVIVKLWENTATIKLSDFQNAQLASFNAIYKYFYDTLIKGGVSGDRKRQIQERFARRECLWDESTGKFWQPKHAFLDDVSFFGNRRTNIPISNAHCEVYQLLGQKNSPAVQDYLDFLAELAAEYGNSALNEADKNCTIQVFRRLESQQLLEGVAVKNIPILTANNTLCPVQKVLIPDAHWRKDYIDSNRILHDLVSAKFALEVGCLSLLKDAVERPTTVKLARQTKSCDWCLEWQNTLNSAELRSGLQRLIFDDRESEPI
ncbi:sacsin N-terminal ATP-binding-like domain-containing protein [Microcoleus sp. herbarium7]|uniref:sacsin N-terminal ATP-binding-like domain-containing protein n=1 Tax=Microcoleus sp. herbarium7 TaxID=3055435 RepID=UPI003FA556E9